MAVEIYAGTPTWRCEATWRMESGSGETTKAFEADDVGDDAVEEPAVVGDKNDAAGHVDDGFFQG